MTPHQHRQIRAFYLQRGEQVLAWLAQRPEARAASSCEICDDAHKQEWYDAGYSEAERVGICAIICPPHE